MVIHLEWDSGYGPEWIKPAWKPDSARTKYNSAYSALSPGCAILHNSTPLCAVACATPKANSVLRNFDSRGQSEASFTGLVSCPTSSTKERAPFSRRFGRKKQSKRTELTRVRACASSIP